MSTSSVETKMGGFPSNRLLKEWDSTIMVARQLVETIRIKVMRCLSSDQLEPSIDHDLKSLSLHISCLTDGHKSMVGELEKIKINVAIKRAKKIIGMIFAIVFLVNGLAGFSEALGKGDRHSGMAIALIIINLISVVAMGIHSGITGKKRFNKIIKSQIQDDLNEKKLIIKKYKEIESYYKFIVNMIRPGSCVKEMICSFLAEKQTFVDERLSQSGFSPCWTANAEPGLLVTDSSDNSIEPVTPIPHDLSQHRFRRAVQNVMNAGHILHFFRSVPRSQSRSSTESSVNSATGTSGHPSEHPSEISIPIDDPDQRIDALEPSIVHSLSVASLEAHVDGDEYYKEEDGISSSTP